MTHTPGPWVYGKRKDGSLWISRGDPVKGPHDQSDFYGSEADCRLMIAAPDLLAELKDAVNFMQSVLEERGDHGVSILIRSARAAIAKAEGT